MLVLVSDGFWWRINAMLGFPYRDGTASGTMLYSHQQGCF